MGCVMMRVCHLNTCPVGIATQDPELRRRFRGTPEHVTGYLMLVAEEVREIMASLGVRRFEELIGHTELLEMDAAIDHWKASRGGPLDGAHDARAAARDAALATPVPRSRCSKTRSTGSSCAAARPRSSAARRSGWGPFPVRNVNRTVGGILSGEIARRHGLDGLPEGTIDIAFSRVGGPELRRLARARRDVLAARRDQRLRRARAYRAASSSVRPPDRRLFRAHENMIVGNTVLYGATAGRAFFRGLAGERFAVRNSGAQAVVEGVGDHGCEYMTGGRVVVLGPTGRNFAAGMSGGIAYVYDKDRRFEGRCNLDSSTSKPLDEADAASVQPLISEHVMRTGSVVGRNLLASWDRAPASGSSR